MSLSSADWQALALSLRLAAATTLILLCVCLPLAYWLARWQSPFKYFITAIATLPMVLPPTVLGYYLLVAFSPQHFFGRWYAGLFERSLAFSFTGILLASLLYSLPFALRPLQQAFEQSATGLRETAALFGFPPLKTFFAVLLPNVRPALLSAAMFCFAHTIGEFGVILMIGGNIPGETQVVSITLFNHVENLQTQQANQLALILLLFAFAIVLLSLWLLRERRDVNTGEPLC